MIKMNERYEASAYDGLIVDINPPADVYVVKIAAGSGMLKRGTVLETTDGTEMSVLGTATQGAKANCILAEDVDATNAATGLAYRTGHFAENKLITKIGYTFKITDKEALRDVGILISDAMEY